MAFTPQKALKELLENLNLSHVEIEVYIATLESGNGTASAISKIVGKQRVTTYEVLKRLIKLGFVKVRIKAGSKITYFEPVSIGEIKNKLASKKAQLDESLKTLDLNKDIFTGLFKKSSAKPEVFFFEGVEGVMAAMHDTLDQRPKEILSFSSDKWLDSVFSKHFLKEYWDKRVGLSIRTRGIIPNISKATGYFNKVKNEKELREVRSLSKEQFNFKNEIDMYGNNVCIVSLEEGSEHAIIIRSASIAQSMKDVFEVMWLVSQKYY